MGAGDEEGALWRFGDVAVLKSVARTILTQVLTGQNELLAELRKNEVASR